MSGDGGDVRRTPGGREGMSEGPPGDERGCQKEPQGTRGDVRGELEVEEGMPDVWPERAISVKEAGQEPKHQPTQIEQITDCFSYVRLLKGRAC